MVHGEAKPPSEVALAHAHAYAEEQVVEQPAIGLFAELDLHHRRTRDPLLPRLLSGQIA